MAFHHNTGRKRFFPTSNLEFSETKVFVTFEFNAFISALENLFPVSIGTNEV